MLPRKYPGANVAGQLIASISMCICAFRFYPSVCQSTSLLWHTADFLQLQLFQLTLIVSVAMLPPFGPIVGGKCVSHNCSVDRKAEAQDRLSTEKELDPLLWISLWIFFLFCWFFLHYGRGGRQPTLLLRINYLHYLFKYPGR